MPSYYRYATRYQSFRGHRHHHSLTPALATHETPARFSFNFQSGTNHSHHSVPSAAAWNHTLVGIACCLSFYSLLFKENLFLFIYLI
jgi:hypothetical protein